MRCQICNRITNNWEKNKQTGKYECICSHCREVINDTNDTYKYKDFDEDLIDMNLTEEEFLEALEEEDKQS